MSIATWVNFIDEMWLKQFKIWIFCYIKISRVNKNPLKTEWYWKLNWSRCIFYTGVAAVELKVNTSLSFYPLSRLIRRMKAFFITSWKTVNNRFWEKGGHQGCVFVPHQCVRRVLCVSVQPSLKSSVSGWIEGSGSDFPRKWKEETRGFRPLWLHWSHKTTLGKEGDGGKGGG